mgnify:FL=1|jgi:hypothetical protein
MRNTIWSITSTVKPMIQVTSWTPRYPYLQRFIKHPESAEALAQLTDEMRNVFQFYDSKIKYEIRIADIIASAYFRRFVKNEISLSDAIQMIGSQRVIKNNQQFTLDGFVDAKNPNSRNPYTNKIDGVTMDELRSKYK